MSARSTGGAKHRLMAEMQELAKESWVNIDVRYPIRLFPGWSDPEADMIFHSWLTPIFFGGVSALLLSIQKAPSMAATLKLVHTALFKYGISTSGTHVTSNLNSLSRLR